MPNLNFTFQTRYGNAVVCKDDVISLEDVDGRMCVVTIKHPNEDVHRLYSSEKASILIDRFNGRTVVNKDSEPVNIKVIKQS